ETTNFTPTIGWNTQPVTTQVSLTPGTYWLAYLPSDNNLAFVKNQDSTASGAWYSYAYGTMPQTFSTNPNTTASHWSFYATLNTTGAPAPSPTPIPTPTGTPTPAPTPTPTPPPPPSTATQLLSTGFETGTLADLFTLNVSPANTISTVNPHAGTKSLF